MIMQNKRFVFEDMSAFERGMSELKLKCYELMNGIVEFCFVSPYLYRFLMIVETMQLIGFSIHPRFAFFWSSSLLRKLQSFLINLQF